MTLYQSEIESPLGTLLLVSDGHALCSLDFGDCRDRMRRLLELRYPGAEPIRADDPGGADGRVRDYLAGDLGALGEIEVETGGTPFQRQVWAALRRIPAGETWSYAELARQVGRPGAARAVGSANGRNPVALVLPCHRVIAADGSLAGYAGGLERKRWLLAHEGARAPAPSAAGFAQMAG